MPDFERIKRLLNTPVIFDGRNMYRLDEVEKHGFHYESIGRKAIRNE
jgi:UDPglucose 6-dehydrogenase